MKKLLLSKSFTVETLNHGIQIPPQIGTSKNKELLFRARTCTPYIRFELERSLQKSSEKGAAHGLEMWKTVCHLQMRISIRHGHTFKIHTFAEPTGLRREYKVIINWLSKREWDIKYMNVSKLLTSGESSSLAQSITIPISWVFQGYLDSPTREGMPEGDEWTINANASEQ